MNLRTTLSKLLGTTRPRSNESTRRLLIESMEDRRLMAVIDLATLTPTQGSKIVGATVISLDSAGDVNGDGFGDTIVGSAGTSYVIFGEATPPALIDLNNLGTGGITLLGPEGYSGYHSYSVSGAGDINGDGFDDLLIGVPAAFTTYNPYDIPGYSYVVFGGDELPSTIDMSSPGAVGMTIRGGGNYDLSGASVSGAGDINGDGFDDLVIGAVGTYGGFGAFDTYAGKCYVIFGSASPSSFINLGTVGPPVMKIVGADDGDRTGTSVRAAGDVNGDGLADLLIGSDGADGLNNGKLSVGESYVVFGSTSPPSTLNLATLGTGGIRIVGVDAGDYSGLSVSDAGDINGDGFDDLIISASFGDASQNNKTDAGETYVVFGGATPPTTIDLSVPGAAGMTIFGADAGDRSGRSVSSAGDVNGDGFDDLIIGASNADGAGNSKLQAGESFVIYGGLVLPLTIDLTNLGTAGIAILGAEADAFSGKSVSNAGDMNGDGFDDIIVDASKTYSSFVIFGGAGSTSSVTRQGTNVAETLIGTTGADVMVAGAASDILLGNGGTDVLIGGQGDDVIAVRNLNFKRIVGGSGSDTLRLDGSGLSLNLTTISDNRIQDIETIDLTGSGNNRLTLARREVVNISDTSNTLIVRGNAGDRVDYGISWTQQANQVINGITFLVFVQGLATLKVQTGVTVNQAPVIAGFAGQVSYIEGASPVILDNNATISDVDSVNFATGKLTINIIENSQSTDRIRIKHTGNGPGQIGVSGTTVRYGGVTIGSFVGNTNFIVTLNGNATQPAVQALLQNLTYETLSNSPSILARTMKVTLTDGDGGTSNSPTKKVTVRAINDAPVISAFGTTVNYTRGGPAVLISSSATVTDVDSVNFSGGKLTIRTIANGQGTDEFGVRNQGTGAGKIGFSGANITYGGVVIGTQTGGKGLTPLTITFNANATAAAVQALLRNVTWRSTLASPPVGPRTISVTLSDGDGGLTQPLTKQISIV